MKYLSESLKNQKNLKTLNLGGNKMKPSSIFSESLLHNSSITNLQISSNKSGDEGMKYLSETLKTNHFVKQLNISKNLINNKGMVFFSESLKHNSSLHIIDLSHNIFEEKGMNCLSESLIVNNNLKEINLSSLKFSNESTKRLSEALKINCSLNKIDLSLNDIRTQGMYNLFDSLAHNQTLKNVNLSCNYFNGEVFSKIQNLNLEILDLSLNSLKIDQIIPLFEYLKKNHTLKHLDISKCGLSWKELIPKIIDLIKTNDTLLEIETIYIDNQINYLLDCNVKWSPDYHSSSNSKIFIGSVFTFVCCLKSFEKNLPFKIVKFILFEIIKKIDRKSFQHLDYHKKKLN